MITKSISLEAAQEAKKRWDSLAKPVGSLGELERLIERIASIQGTADVRIDRRKIVVFCADNGITAENICGSDPSLTAILAETIANARGNVSVMAAAAGCEVICVDIGLFSANATANVLDRKIRCGTRNFAKEPSMTLEEVKAAIQVGEELAATFAKDTDILLAGEVGIGNTTTSAAVAAALLGRSAKDVVGRGAGLDDAGLVRKIQVIDSAIERYGLRRSVDFQYGRSGFPEENRFDKEGDASSCACHPERSEGFRQGVENAKDLSYYSNLENRRFAFTRTCHPERSEGSRQETEKEKMNPQKNGYTASPEETLRILRCVGGLDIAAMAGLYMGCAKMHIPAILDGAISAAAALVAERLLPGTKNFLLASHRSREPMAALHLRELGLTPILQADLALGEGTGGICLLPPLDLALAAYRNAATFAESGLCLAKEGGQTTYIKGE